MVVLCFATFSLVRGRFPLLLLAKSFATDVTVDASPQTLWDECPSLSSPCGLQFLADPNTLDHIIGRKRWSHLRSARVVTTLSVVGQSSAISSPSCRCNGLADRAPTKATSMLLRCTMRPLAGIAIHVIVARPS